MHIKKTFPSQIHSTVDLLESLIYNSNKGMKKPENLGPNHHIMIVQNDLPAS